jgi:hypothetical protein
MKNFRFKASKALKADKDEHMASHNLVLSIQNLKDEL